MRQKAEDTILQRRNLYIEIGLPEKVAKTGVDLALLMWTKAAEKEDNAAALEAVEVAQKAKDAFVALNNFAEEGALLELIAFMSEPVETGPDQSFDLLQQA